MFSNHIKMDINALFLMFLLSFSVPVYSAGEDSLKIELNKVQGKEKILVILKLMQRLEKTEPAEAVKFGNEALELLKDYDDKELEAEIVCRIGWAFSFMNERDSAKFHAELAGKISGEIGYSKGSVMVLLLSARIKRTEGLYEDALSLLKTAQEKNEDADDMLLGIKILNEYGSVYRRISRFDEAMENHKEALKLLEKNGDEEELTVTYTYLGILNDIKGNYDEALGNYQKALELNKKSKDIRGMAGSIHNIGILYQRIEKYDLALEYYNEALEYWNKLRNQDGLASTLNSIGAVNELKKNYHEALKYYQQALNIWEKSGKKLSEAIALNNIGSIYENLGRYKEAIDYLRRAIEIRRSVGDKDGTAGSMIVLASVYNKTGDAGVAIKTAKEALILAKDGGAWSSIREAHNVLADIYESNGFYKEALTEYKNYKIAHDSIFNLESQQAIAEIQEKYKSEEQKRQIEILERDNKIQVLYGTLLIAGLILLLIILVLLYNRNRLKQREANLRTEAAESKAAVLQSEFEQKKKELDAARDLQLSMLPSKIPQHPEVEISALMLPAAEVGGDYYDFHTSEDGTLTIALGDATGHGAQAGIMVTAVKSLFSLLSEKKDITEILRNSTYAIRKMNFPNIFMALGLLRLKDSELELAGAGIPPAYIYRKNSGEVEEVSLKGLPLGSISDYRYPKKSIKLFKDDVIVVMSDGFPELFNDKKEILGFDKIPLLLKETAVKSAEEIISHFTNAASLWLNGNRQQDDITFVVLKVK